MTRMYIQPSWIDAASDHGEWSGGNGQYRGDRSVDVATFDKRGRARVEAFSDQAIDSLKKRKTSIPLRQRILPQEVRLNTLDTQIEELNQEYNSNRMPHVEYVQLKTILDKKRARAWELYVKAGGVVQESIEDEELPIELACETNDSHSANSVCGVAIIDDLSDENCLKVFLQKACTTAKTLVKWCQRAKAYYQTLKEI